MRYMRHLHFLKASFRFTKKLQEIFNDAGHDINHQCFTY
jgi:hypothetical protein